MINNNNVNNTNSLFTLDNFKQKFTPDNVGIFNLNESLYKETRVNHLLVKQPNENICYPDNFPIELKNFVDTCYKLSLKQIDSTNKRYLYLTFDNEEVKEGNTQRDQGYHIDGLQGDEVPVKVNNCYQFICFNSLPTVFVNQSFNVNNLNSSRHNVFNYLGDQVKETNTFNTKSNNIYFMNPYMVHRAQQATTNQKRLFVRLYFSHLPTTSLKATINPSISYKFKTGTTSGNIPNHLK